MEVESQGFFQKLISIISKNKLKFIFLLVILLMCMILTILLSLTSSKSSNSTSSSQSSINSKNSSSISSSISSHLQSSNTSNSSARNTLIDKKLTLISPDAVEGGYLNSDYTCDGSGATLPLNWSYVPEGTQSFVLTMGLSSGESWNWILYNIPSSSLSLPKNVKNVGKFGSNSFDNLLSYSPPCLVGTDNKYTFTLYALSEIPKFLEHDSEINHEVLTNAIKNITIQSATLNVKYSN